MKREREKQHDSEEVLGGDFSHEVFVRERPTYRKERYASRIKEEISTMIPGGLKDKRLSGIFMITITDVKVTQDLRNATVYFSLMAQEEHANSVAAALNKAASFLRRELMYRLNTKTTPHLSFKFDNNVAYADQMHRLFQQI